MDVERLIPDSLFEWQLFGFSLFVLFLAVTFAVTTDLLYAISIGLRGAIGVTIVSVIVAFSWRRLQRTPAHG